LLRSTFPIHVQALPRAGAAHDTFIYTAGAAFTRYRVDSYTRCAIRNLRVGAAIALLRYVYHTLIARSLVGLPFCLALSARLPSAAPRLHRRPAAALPLHAAPTHSLRATHRLPLPHRWRSRTRTHARAAHNGALARRAVH